MNNQIEIKVGRAANGAVEVSWKLPNGYEGAQHFEGNDIGREQARWFANGIRSGLAIAKNAIGFVPAIVDNL